VCKAARSKEEEEEEEGERERERERERKRGDGAYWYIRTYVRRYVYNERSRALARTDRADDVRESPRFANM
jgi:hypothetical protein